MSCIPGSPGCAQYFQALAFLIRIYACIGRAKREQKVYRAPLKAFVFLGAHQLATEEAVRTIAGSIMAGYYQPKPSMVMCALAVFLDVQRPAGHFQGKTHPFLTLFQGKGWVFRCAPIALFSILLWILTSN
jgi:hypothetical protein